jgi:hypothetical protein
MLWAQKKVMLVNKLKYELGNSKYNKILTQCPYDNFQIFIPVDIPKYQDNSARTAPWFTIMLMCNLLIPLSCYALVNRIYLRGCITAGKYFQTKERIFGPAIDEAAEFCEKANWIGIVASPLTAEVLDRAASIDKYSNDWFKTFIEYDIPLNEKNAQGKDIEGRRKAWAFL